MRADILGRRPPVRRTASRLERLDSGGADHGRGQEGEPAAILRAAAARGITHLLVDKREAARDDRAMRIADDNMRRCCLAQLDQDKRFVLFALADGAADESQRAIAATDWSAACTMRQVCGMWKCPAVAMPGSTYSIVPPSHQSMTWRVAASRAVAPT